MIRGSAQGGNQHSIVFFSSGTRTPSRTPTLEDARGILRPEMESFRSGTISSRCQVRPNRRSTISPMTGATIPLLRIRQHPAAQ